MTFAFKSLLSFIEEEQIHNSIVLTLIIEVVENVVGKLWENDFL